MSDIKGYKTYDRTYPLSNQLVHYLYYAKKGAVLVSVWPRAGDLPLIKAQIVMDGKLYAHFYYTPVNNRRQAADLARQFLREIKEGT